MIVENAFLGGVTWDKGNSHMILNIEYDDDLAPYCSFRDIQEHLSLCTSLHYRGCF